MKRVSGPVRRRDERGVVLPLTAFLLVGLLSFVALSIDIGRLGAAHRQLQNAADAGALAGVQVLPNNVADAKDAGITWAMKNGLVMAEVQTPVVSQTNVANDTITVTVNRTVDYTFARVMGRFNKSVTATSTAVVGSVVGSIGIMPFGMVDLNGPDNPGFGYTFGQEYTLKEVPGKAFGPGNYGFLALDGRGGDNLRDVIANGGSTTRYLIGDQVYTEPGQKTGPTRQGLDDWAASHNDTIDGSTCNDWDASHTYTGGKLTIAPKCQYRVVLIPIIDQWPNGRKQVEILGFAQIYLTGYDENNGKAISGIFLEDSWSHPGAQWGPVDSYGTRIVKLTS